MIRQKFPEVEVMAASAGSDDEGSMFSLFTTTGFKYDQLYDAFVAHCRACSARYGTSLSQNA
jgi:hypothetical protein